jgi:DNA segregation ATPase FtsK/SpoIIIE, S-DNA-T family
MQARSAGQGIILAPGQPADGDFLGVRLEVDYRCGPGRAFLVQPGQVTELQTALAAPADAAA